MRGKYKRDWLKGFWAKIQVLGPDECWPWLGSRLKKGYGHVTLNQKVSTTSHRVLLEITSGNELPKEIDACHSCDHPWCMNPDHVFPGTKSQNTQDMIRKGRTNYHRPTKRLLDWKKAEKIREVTARTPIGRGKSGSFRAPLFRRLAKKYKTSVRAIQKAAAGETWYLPKPS
jgi:hypothetical protein